MAEKRNPAAHVWSRSGGEGASDAVYAAVRGAILRGDFAPGSPLREEDLARFCGTSRTPVREALVRLETEQLAVRSGRRGLVVRKISADELIEVYVVREALEGMAARIAAQSAAPADIARLHRMNGILREIVASPVADVDRAAAANMALHNLICKITRNTLLIDAVQQLFISIRQFPGTPLSNESRRAGLMEEHSRIVDAIERGDADQAEEAARDHIRRALGARVEILEEFPVHDETERTV